MVSQVAWKSLGFDIDEKATTKRSTDVCQLAPNASHTTQVDGQGGIDNSFGAAVLGIVQSTLAYNGPPIGQEVLDSIEHGLVTDLLVVHGLGSATTASPLSASLVIGAPLGAKPTWSATDLWPVDSSSLSGGDAGAPLLGFPASYVAGGVFVAEPPSGEGEIALGIVLGLPIVLSIRHVQVAMTLSADGMTATSGTISGILPTDRLVEAVLSLYYAGIALPCTYALSDIIVQWVEQAQDILLDGTQDPSQPCNGVSIGLGFEAVRVQRGPVVDVPPLADACLGQDAGP